jgi:hypothetical protein
MQEVLRAPERRLDNAITLLYDNTRLLLLHAKITREVLMRMLLISTYRDFVWSNALFWWTA